MSGINNTEVLFNHFLKTALNVVTHFDKEDERSRILEDLEGIIVNNCIYDEKMKKLTDTIKELVDNIDDNNNPDEIMKEFKKQKHKILAHNPDVKNHPNLIQYCSELKKIIADADGVTREKIDDDIQVTQNAINIIDPFTKKQMTHPVKNKVCGHVYDRESIISILKMKKETRCPVIGCINKQYISEQNLISDITTKKFLQKNTLQA